MINSIQTKISAYTPKTGTRNYGAGNLADENYISGKRKKDFGAELQRCNEDVSSVFEKMKTTSKVRVHTSGVKLADSLLMEVKGNLQRMENADFIIQEEQELKGQWSVRDKKTGEIFVIDPRQTSLQEYEGRNYLVSEDSLGVMGIYAAKDTLISSLKEFMNTDKLSVAPISETLEVTINQETGIRVFREKGKNDHYWMLVEDDEQLEKLQKLADVYRESYPTLVQTDEAAFVLAKWEVAGNVARTDHGYMIIAMQQIEFCDENNPDGGWLISYSDEEGILYDKLLKDLQENRQKNMENYDFWKEWLGNSCEVKVLPE